MEHDPTKNKNAISLIKQEDGNWIGIADRHGVIITARDTGPETVLLALITHD